MANRKTRVSKSTLPTLSVIGEMVQALKDGEISPPEAGKVDEVVQPEPEVVGELPELVPDVANPEGVPPAEQQEEQPAPPAPAAGPVLHVKKGLALRGGRGEWYKLLCQYDGKPVAEYIAEGKANPASHYTARSTKCGQPKTPESRLSWFKRAGIVTIK